MDEARLNHLRTLQRHEGGGSGEDNRVSGLIDLLRYTKSSNVLEIGSYKGISTEVLCILCSLVTSVDIYITNELSTLGTKYNNLSILKGRSPDVLFQFPDSSFDLVYIDAEHDYDSVHKDFLGSIRLIKPDGFISGHDFRLGGVQEVVKKYSKRFRTFEDDSWVIRKEDLTNV